MTQYEIAKSKKISDLMKTTASKEYLDAEFIRSEIEKGRLVIFANKNHKTLDPIAVGRSVRCKINANIGNSPLSSNLNEEIKKLYTAVKYGADTVMDLSTGGNIKAIRDSILKESTVPVGTVPIYEILANAKKIENIKVQTIIDTIKSQAEQGVDYMTIHCGLLKKFIPMACSRVTKIVSRGGSIVAKWMNYYNKENPFYENFDAILDICKEHDVTLSLGDGLRPGCLADASDNAQFSELKVLGELTLKCREKGVQVIIEGPGHIPFDQIEMNMKKQKELCYDAPFYVLGPIVTDVAPGYDHITSSIGATMAGFYGASMLCYVTPKEHLGLPDAEDVRNGIIAYKIAAHAVDIANKRPKAREWDDKMSKARFEFDWEKQFSLAMDPDRAREFYNKIRPKHQQKENYCTMCGPEFCAMKNSSQIKSKPSAP